MSAVLDECRLSSSGQVKKLERPTYGPQPDRHRNGAASWPQCAVLLLTTAREGRMARGAGAGSSWRRSRLPNEVRHSRQSHAAFQPFARRKSCSGLYGTASGPNHLLFCYSRSAHARILAGLPITVTGTCFAAHRGITARTCPPAAAVTASLAIPEGRTGRCSHGAETIS